MSKTMEFREKLSHPLNDTIQGHAVYHFIPSIVQGTLLLFNIYNIESPHNVGVHLMPPRDLPPCNMAPSFAIHLCEIEYSKNNGLFDMF